MDYKNHINNAGDFNLEALEIISYHREQDSGDLFRMDISNVFISIEITEDIFSNYIVGRVRIQDTQDIRTMLPITGLERLNLKLNTPGCPGYNALDEEGHPFQIYKIESVAQDGTSGRSQVYDILFCSQEMYFNGIHRVSKAYAGPLEFAVDDIFHNKQYLNSTKRLNYEPTAINEKIVIPNMKPIQAIKFIASRSKSIKYKNAGYLFYETSEGYFFRSIESLLALNGAAVRPVKFAYTYQAANVNETSTGVEDINQKMRGVNKYEFKRPVDVLEHMTNGMLGNRLIRHDAFDKTFKTTDYNYFDDFGKYFHMEHDDTDKSQLKSLLPFVPFEDTNTDLSSNPLAKLMTVSNTSKLHDAYDTTQKSETVQQMVSQRAQYMSPELNLDVYGNTLLHAGDMINFDMDLMRPLGEDGKSEPSPYWNGRYLIRAIKHKIVRAKDGGQHTMTIQCVKDSVRTEYPISTETMVVNKPENEVNSIYDLDANLLNSDLNEGV